MYTFDSLIEFFDENRHCLIFCNNHPNYSRIFDDFKYHEDKYFSVYRTVLYVIGGFTNVLFVVTVFILARYGKNLDRTYRNTMIFITIIPVLSTNHVCFLWQPYVIGPQFIIYSLGPIRTSYYSTALLIISFVMTTISLTFLQFSQLSYHFLIIISPQNTLKMFRVNVFWYFTAFSSVTFNTIVLFLAIDRQHYRAEAVILSVTPQFQYMIDNYAPYIVDLTNATPPMNLILLEAMFAVVLFTVLTFYAIYRVFRSYFKNRSFLSQRLTEVQKKIIITLFTYQFVFYFLLAFPTQAVSSFIIGGVEFRTVPISSIYFSSVSMLATCFCVINLSSVTPYRRAIISFLKRILPFGSHAPPTATVSDNHQAAVIIPTSLFTRNLPLVQGSN